MAIAGLVLAGAATAWVFYQAKSGAAQIVVPEKPIWIGVGSVIFGLFCILFGQRALRDIESLHNGSPIRWYHWICLIAMVAAMYYCSEALIHYLESVGYHKIDHR